MAASAFTPLTEYLRTVYRPDRESVDGEVRERNLGEYDHGAVQAALARWFSAYRREWNIRVITELRVQVAPRAFAFPMSACLTATCPLSRSSPGRHWSASRF